MRVELQQGHSGPRWAMLRPVTGADELALDAGSSGAGTRLLANLLTDAPGAAVGPGAVGSLDIFDRDRLLAAIYSACFGDDIEGMAPCAACGADYEFHFSLGALKAHQTPAAVPGVEGPDERGYYRATQGARFRLPTVADLHASEPQSAERAMQTLLERCVEGATGDIDANAVQSLMEQLAPSLELDIAARCPHCETSGNIAFGMEAFLVGALVRERRFLTLEVHRLALAYGWSLAEILSLSRDDRRTLVRQVQLDGIASPRR